MGPGAVQASTRAAKLNSRGITGDVVLHSRPRDAFITDVFCRPSVRQKRLDIDVTLTGVKTGDISFTADASWASASTSPNSGPGTATIAAPFAGVISGTNTPTAPACRSWARFLRWSALPSYGMTAQRAPPGGTPSPPISVASVTALAILRRSIDSRSAALPAPLAEAVLEIRFADVDQARMGELADKSNRGALTPQEAAEYDEYIAVADVLSLWHSKARLALIS
jgi:hypothetical protein